MELSPRRVTVGLALHAMGGALLLFGRRVDWVWAAIALVVAASSAVLTRSMV